MYKWFGSRHNNGYNSIVTQKVIRSKKWIEQKVDVQNM